VPDLRPDLPQMRPIEPSAPVGCVATALIAIGALILVPSGLCTAIMGMAAIAAWLRSPTDFWNNVGVGSHTFITAVGFAIVGAMLTWAGRRLRGKK